MTREIQSQLLGEFYAEKKNVMKLKSEDYANEDVLSNFKTAGANIGISAEQQCLSLIATKVARLGNLLSGKIPNNESVSDSILDLSNYTDLLYCLVNEEKENSKFSEGILNDFKKFNDAADKNEADFLKRKHAKSQPLLPEECSEPEPQTKRWENVSPHPMLDVIANMNKTIQAGAEWHKKRREEAELISEPYEPKVGDVLVYNTLIYKWEIEYLDDNAVHLNAMGGLQIKQGISRELFLEYIKESVLKKIN